MKLEKRMLLLALLAVSLVASGCDELSSPTDPGGVSCREVTPRTLRNNLDCVPLVPPDAGARDREGS